MGLRTIRQIISQNLRLLQLFNLIALACSIIWLPVLLIGLLIVVPLARYTTRQRRHMNMKPRVLRGTYVLPDTAYKVVADRRNGYDSYLLIWQPSYYNRAWEIPWHVQRFYALYQLLALPRYIGFLWSLLHFDLFQYYFDHQQLHGTVVGSLELRILKAAGKLIVLFPYGGDVILPGMRAYGGADFYDLVARDYQYSATAKWRHQVRRQISLASQSADYIISVVPYLDIMPVVHLKYHYVAIDVAEWTYHEVASHPKVRIVHASNHRHNKGTDIIVQVCQELEAAGYPIEFRLLEKIPREETKRICAESDIVIEQLLSGNIGMFGIECMAMGKPVVAYLREDILEHHPWMTECPIANANPATLRERLIELINDPAQRQRLGKDGRSYVERYHSLEAIGALSDRIYRHVWFGETMNHEVALATAHD